MSRGLVRICLAVAVVAAGAAVPVHAHERPTSCRDVRLSRLSWDAARSESLTARSPTPAEALGSSLVRCHSLVGLKRSQVRAVLGRPDTATQQDWQYQLDLDRGILSRAHYLDVVYGARGVVRSSSL